jgi:hypothetical protein
MTKMIQTIQRIEVASPADVGVHTRLTVSLTGLGLTVENLRGVTPVIVAKKVAAGNGDTLDEKATIVGTNLLIDESTNGFTAGDVYTVDLQRGVPTPTGAASTPQ